LVEVRKTLDSRFRGNDDFFVIPGERERGLGSKWAIGCEGHNFGPDLRRDDDDCVIPSLRSGQARGEPFGFAQGRLPRDPGSNVFLNERTTLDSRFRGNDDAYRRDDDKSAHH
jgi:hypothetical protein